MNLIRLKIIDLKFTSNTIIQYGRLSTPKPMGGDLTLMSPP